MTTAARPTDDAATADLNEVTLAGRVSGDPVARELPSGDTVVTWRLVVARPAGGPVDTIDCASWSAASRRSTLRLTDGDRVTLSGALHRRFFRTPGGPASRYEVEVQRVRREK